MTSDCSRSTQEIRVRPVQGGARGALRLLLSVVLLSAVLPPVLPGQAPQTTRGREFWVAFMENLGSGNALEVSDLRLYMASDSITTVYVRFLPLDDTLEVQLTSPGIPVELRINDFWQSDPSYSPELEAVGPTGTNSISDRSFHITADHEITLYGSNIRSLSADAFLALPDNVLSGSYFVMAWQNGFNGEWRPEYPVGFDTHSEFAVIATEDNTEVTVRPTAPLLGQAGILSPDSFTVLLDRGEVYFGQALLDTAWDVTGTEVSATKPVALFGGNQRTSIPTEVGNYRDHLVEQMPPLEAWGTEAYLTPHFEVDPRVTYEAVARILAAEDGTELSITTCVQTSVTMPDGSNRDTLVEQTRTEVLNRGESIEIHPLEAAHVVATAPILVAQYEHSVGGDPLARRDGDPFMMLIPPPTQFDRSYPFQSIVDSGVLAHYINVVIPRGGEGSLRIDGQKPLPPPVWEKLPGGRYLYAQIRVLPGAHRIEADSAFGLEAYGFGPAMSYGYIGASLFRDLPIDYSRPDIRIVEECDFVTGMVSDSAVNDRGIDSVYATALTSNVRLIVDPFTPGAAAVSWRAELEDPGRDGLLEIRVIDRAGRSSTERVGIPGFTVAMEFASGGSGIGDSSTVELVSYNGTEVCTELILHNYGKHRRQVRDILFDGGSVLTIEVDTTFPLVLEPGDSTRVRICTPGLETGIENLRVSLSGDCADLEVGTLIAAGVRDSIPPGIESGYGVCSGEGRIRLVEEDLRFYGVASVDVESIDNGTWRIDPGRLPSTTVDLMITPIDMRQDVVLTFRVADLAGNVIRRVDTIGGFTLALFDSAGNSPQLALRLERDWRGEELILTGRECDSLRLVNYGSRLLTIDRAFMLGNSLLSIPPAQLPLIIPPGESLALGICREGMRAGETIDTLRLEDGCGRWETVALRYPVTEVDGNGRDGCGELITVRSSGAARRNLISTPFPNPNLDGEVSLDLGLTAESDITIELLDERGNPALLLLRGRVDEGLHRLSFDVTTLPSGSYYCRMVTGDGEVLSTRFSVLR